MAIVILVLILSMHLGSQAKYGCPRKIRLKSCPTLKSNEMLNCRYSPFHDSYSMPNSNSKFRAVDKLGAVEELLRFDAYAFISNYWPDFVFSHWSCGLYILSACR